MREKKLLLYISILLLLTLITLTFQRLDKEQSKKLHEDISVVVKPIESIVPEVLKIVVPHSELPPEKITLDKVFDGIDSFGSSDDDWTLLVGGDVMVGRTVNYKILSYNDFDWPFKNISGVLTKPDLTFVNLESPVVDNCPTTMTGMIFCGNLNSVGAIKRAGIDAVSISNNHILNHGKNGLETTLKTLQENNIAAVGAPNPTYMNVKGNRIALLAYTDVECYPGVPCVNEELIKSDVANAKQNSDLVIIMYHWGIEYQDYPSSRQREIAHMSIDAGADLILGNHPHWIQPFEIYKDKMIMYSHGNLVFDQMWSQKTKEGVLVEYNFHKNNLVDAKIYPILIEDFGQPHFMDENASMAKIEFLKKTSENLAAGNY